jgi:hypothetical protein
MRNATPYSVIFTCIREDYLKGIIKISRLRSVLDALSKITRLYNSGIRITTLYKVRAMRCYNIGILLGVATRSTYLLVDSKLP